MREVSSLRGKWWWNIVFSIVAVSVVVGDQMSKAWIRSNLALGESSPEGGFFFFTHIRNTGASFGLFREYSFQLTIIAFVAIGIVLFYAFFITRCYPVLNNMISKSALGSILGGAVGNLIDRLRFGYITDFIGVGAWPPYNVADASIVTGVVVFAGSLLYLVFGQERGKKASRKD
jgi:signal peptidase II